MTITIILLVLAWLVAGGNLFAVWQNSRVPHNVSTMPAVVQIFVALAWMVHTRFAEGQLSPWVFVVTAISDVSLWQLLGLLLRRKRD